MNNPDMTGFAVIKLTAEMIDELKKEWTMYTCNGWIGIHKETGKKIKCGTYYSLLNLAYSYSRDLTKVLG